MALRTKSQTEKRTPYRETDALNRPDVDDLEAQKAAFLARGGKIEQIPIGVGTGVIMDRRTAETLKAKRVLGTKQAAKTK
jgi:hypothetical protein